VWDLPKNNPLDGLVQLPSDSCDLDLESTSTNYVLKIPSQEYFKEKQVVKITMESPILNFGQAKNVSLYNNGQQIGSYGDYIAFNSNQKDFELPEDITESNCYYFRITYFNDIYYSEKFTIIK
jgi:hypothetical protein